MTRRDYDRDRIALASFAIAIAVLLAADAWGIV